MEFLQRLWKPAWPVLFALIFKHLQLLVAIDSARYLDTWPVELAHHLWLVGSFQRKPFDRLFHMFHPFGPRKPIGRLWRFQKSPNETEAALHERGRLIIAPLLTPLI